MRTILGAALLIATVTTGASALDDMHCKVGPELFVDAPTLATDKVEAEVTKPAASTYRISDNNLFINRAGPTAVPDEYRYGKMVHAVSEDNRYVVGHKTFIFEGYDNNPTKGVVVHASLVDVRIAPLTCRAVSK